MGICRWQAIAVTVKQTLLSRSRCTVSAAVRAMSVSFTMSPAARHLGIRWMAEESSQHFPMRYSDPDPFNSVPDLFSGLTVLYYVFFRIAKLCGGPRPGERRRRTDGGEGNSRRRRERRTTEDGEDFSPGSSLGIKAGGICFLLPNRTRFAK